jgi:DNA-binding transcriptional MocR family regulator
VLVCSIQFNFVCVIISLFLVDNYKFILSFCQGMFLWFRLHGIEDTEVLIKEKAKDMKVLMVPGKFFSPLNKPSPHVRASFSIAPEKVTSSLSSINS